MSIRHAFSSVILIFFLVAGVVYARPQLVNIAELNSTVLASNSIGVLRSFCLDGFAYVAFSGRNRTSSFISLKTNSDSTECDKNGLFVVDEFQVFSEKIDDSSSALLREYVIMQDVSIILFTDKQGGSSLTQKNAK